MGFATKRPPHAFQACESPDFFVIASMCRQCHLPNCDANTSNTGAGAGELPDDMDDEKANDEYPDGAAPADEDCCAKLPNILLETEDEDWGGAECDPRQDDCGSGGKEDDIKGGNADTDDCGCATLPSKAEQANGEDAADVSGGSGNDGSGGGGKEEDDANCGNGAICASGGANG